jgi:hypothetical protein
MWMMKQAGRQAFTPHAEPQFDNPHDRPEHQPRIARVVTGLHNRGARHSRRTAYDTLGTEHATLIGMNRQPLRPRKHQIEGELTVRHTAGVHGTISVKCPCSNAQHHSE